MTDKKDIEGVPELLQMRNNLYLGNYSYCIAEDVKVNTNEAKLEKEILLQRAHIGLGQYDLVLSEINDSKETPLALRVNSHFPLWIQFGFLLNSYTIYIYIYPSFFYIYYYYYLGNKVIG